MDILLCLDKFKASATSVELCEWIAFELAAVENEWQVVQSPVADGGDGSLAILKLVLNAQEIVVETFDPLGVEIKASYLIKDNIAYIELASASGLHLLKEEDYDPYLSSTYGTGVLVRDALSKGVETVKVFLGGSATIDGGMGILHALGVHFYSEDNFRLFPSGESLAEVSRINIDVLAKLREVEFELICDVPHVLLGDGGAVASFGAQKGAASIEDHHFFEEALAIFSQLIENELMIDVNKLKSGGAAGGVAASLHAFLNAEIQSGSQFFIDTLQLYEKIRKADVVILGEGRVDDQTSNGKLVGQLMDYCEENKTPYYLICGDHKETDSSRESEFQMKTYMVRSEADSYRDSMQNVETYIKQISQKLAAAIKSSNLE
ncbi:glycerate kinase [Saprospiraceae bacterium]|nr:glycerate kinase [Saprospiraceae bacterium]